MAFVLWQQRTGGSGADACRRRPNLARNPWKINGTGVGSCTAPSDSDECLSAQLGKRGTRVKTAAAIANTTIPDFGKAVGSGQKVEQVWRQSTQVVVLGLVSLSPTPAGTGAGSVSRSLDRRSGARPRAFSQKRDYSMSLFLLRYQSETVRTAFPNGLFPAGRKV